MAFTAQVPIFFCFLGLLINLILKHIENKWQKATPVPDPDHRVPILDVVLNRQNHVPDPIHGIAAHGRRKLAF